MLTRRRFFGTVAALAVGARVAPAVAAPILPVVGGINPATFPFWRVQPEGELWRYCEYGSAGQGKSEPLTPLYGFTRVPRRDDGDTILELR